MIDSKGYGLGCSGRARAELEVPEEEKWEQAPALQIEFSTALIIPEDRGKSTKTLARFLFCGAGMEGPAAMPIK